MELIFPERRPTSPADLASGLRLADRAPADRPYVALNMVASLDGKATLDWRTKGLSSDEDRELFHHLRTQADAVMVGAGTVRAERYGKLVKSDELREKRVGEDMDPEPPAVVVSATLDLAPDLPLFAEPGQRVIVVTGAEHEIEGTAAEVEYVRTGDDLQLALAKLRSDHGLRSILCEGGPTLNSHLFAAGLVDELWLSVSQKTVAGPAALTIVAGRELVEPVDMEPVSIALGADDMFTRWRVRRPR